MATEGGDLHSGSPTDNDESRAQAFTAVNDGTQNNGFAGQTLSQRQSPVLPQISTAPGSISTNSSPSHQLTDDTWLRQENGQKRKRTPDEVSTPMTQQHLAAHEASMGSGHGNGLNQQFSTPMQREDSQEDHGPPMITDEHGLRFAHDDTPMQPNDTSPQPGSQGGDPNKRRKRVFSNRTKTGCITCRRRKKKCDEGKPECSNCKRGGFVCEGYSSKVNWQSQKPSGKGSGQTLSLQMQTKAESDIHSAGSTPIHTRPMSIAVPIGQLPANMDVDPQFQRPEGNAPSEDARSPARQAYGNQSTPVQEAYAHTSAPHTGLPPPTPTSLPAGQALTSPGGTRRPSFSAAALSAATGSSMPRARSEKAKMINSELYRANTPELTAERKNCKAACWRFNNAATNPTCGVSDAECGRLLLEVLRPGHVWETINTPNGGVQYTNESGYQSDIVDCKVDAPFTCSYGYNIRLGKGVFIEFGCTILDSCNVTIKARTILSPNVSIFSATHPIDPRKRNGVAGPEVAKPVLIEEDCWLGGNVIVLGGITIGKGSVVGAGSVVTRDVPPFTVVAGNPARVIRGIYQSNNGLDM